MNESDIHFEVREVHQHCKLLQLRGSVCTMLVARMKEILESKYPSPQFEISWGRYERVFIPFDWNTINNQI